MTQTKAENAAQDVSEAAPAELTRDSIRAQIFASKKPKSEIFDFFGVKLELRQPNLGGVLAARDNADTAASVINTLVDYAYMPGTDIKVFTAEDRDALLEMPFGGDFIRVSEALERLTDVDFRSQQAKAKA